MRGALLALVTAMGVITAWSQAAWSDPLDHSGRRYRGGPTYTERNYERPRVYQERPRDRRRISRSSRRDYGPRYSRRYRDDGPRYSRRRYDDGPRYSRRYDDRRYSRRSYDERPRYTRAYGAPVTYYSRPTVRVLINPNAELPGAHGWRDQHQYIGPLVTPRAIESFFQRSQDRAPN